MARRPTQLPEKQTANLTIKQIEDGLTRLKKRLEDVHKFDPLTVTDQHDAPELEALEASIDDALVRTFGQC